MHAPGNGIQAAMLPDGRLHLQHGPIDLICCAWGPPGAVSAAYAAAADTFPTILPTLCAERNLLRAPLPGPAPQGAIARAMHAACPPDQSLRCGLVADISAPTLDGAFLLTHGQPSRGIATSGRACKGRGGRSFSLGIADAVTVLARTAAMADAAATIIGNAVDLPGHAAVIRRPASDIDPDSDLGDRLIAWDVGALPAADVAKALDAGRLVADALRRRDLIDGAVLALNGQVATSLQPEARAA
jgi:hypothetical protein